MDRNVVYVLGAAVVLGVFLLTRQVAAGGKIFGELTAEEFVEGATRKPTIHCLVTNSSNVARDILVYLVFHFFDFAGNENNLPFLFVTLTLEPGESYQINQTSFMFMPYDVDVTIWLEDWETHEKTNTVLFPHW